MCVCVCVCVFLVSFLVLGSPSSMWVRQLVTDFLEGSQLLHECEDEFMFSGALEHCMCEIISQETL